MQVRPISEAPKDGSVILTEVGFVRYLNQRQWASPVAHGKWACCDPQGNIFECADCGDYLAEPERWTPVPEWMA